VGTTAEQLAKKPSRLAWAPRGGGSRGKTKEVHDLDHPLDTIVENAKRLRLRLDVDIGGHIIELSPTPCSLGLSATSQQYFSLRTNKPPPTSQQYSSLRTN
jgi:hypothetical protein